MRGRREFYISGISRSRSWPVRAASVSWKAHGQAVFELHMLSIEQVL